MIIIYINILNNICTTDVLLAVCNQINAAAEVIYEAVDPNANIIFGALVDESMNGEIAITVIATGFPIQNQGGAGAGLGAGKVVVEEDEPPQMTVAEARRLAELEDEPVLRPPPPALVKVHMCYVMLWCGINVFQT